MHNDRFQRIIELKQRLMEEREREIENLKRELSRVEADLNRVTAEIESNFDTMCLDCLTGNDFAVLSGYIEHLDKEKETWVAEKKGMTSKIEVIRNQLLDLLREVRMLEKLQSKAQATAKRLDDRRQQKVLDQIGLRPSASRTE